MKNKITHLRFCYMTTHRLGISGHAQKIMKELGISYTHSTPQSIPEQFWFWNCQNIPEELPPFLTDLGLTPEECVGYGLSKKEAEEIKRIYWQERSKWT